MTVDNVTVTLKEGMHFEGQTPAGDWIIPLDSDLSAGGSGQGHRPLSLLLTGLLGCMSMDVVSILRKKRQEFTDFKAEAQVLERAEDHPKVYKHLRIHFTVVGNVDPEAMARSIELSETKYCPASAMLRHGTKIETTFTILQPETTA